MEERQYDLLIIGGGAAGLTAGIYAGRAKLKTLIIDRDRPGGQIAVTDGVANYPGVPGASGQKLGEIMKKQAVDFGAEYLSAAVTGVDFSGEYKKVFTDSGAFSAHGVIIAAGALPRKLGFKGEEEFRGRGIGYCATCDGEFFTGMDVFVIGAGFAAAEEALFLTRYAKKVVVIAREPEFTCSKAIAEKVLAHPKIEVRFRTEIREVGGDRLPAYAVFENNETGEITRYENPDSFGVFVFVGYRPQSELFKGVTELDEQGYIVTDEDMRTNIPGVFAAGDIRIKKLRQLVTAVSDGAIAATEAERYISGEKERLTAAMDGGAPPEREPEGFLDGGAPPEREPEGFLDGGTKAALAPVLARFEKELTLVLLGDGGELAAEMGAFAGEFAALSPKIRFVSAERGGENGLFEKVSPSILPALAILDSNGKYTGIQFHGVPGGHEINPFVAALYNTAGPGAELEPATLEKICSIRKKVNLKIGVSLSCSLCPDAVKFSQLIAQKSGCVEAEMIDVARFPDFRKKHSIMSVPALIVNDEKAVFGKKSLDQIIELLKNA